MDDVLRGGEGDDFLQGFDGDDLLEGGPGRDELRGGYGEDTLEGEDGNDELHGQADSDILRGGPGTDRIWGKKGDDILEGGEHADRIWAGGGLNLIDGGDGYDLCDGPGATDYCETEPHDWSAEEWRDLVAEHFDPLEQTENALLVMDCESGGNPFAKNPVSTASGLFQFLDSTWAWVAGNTGSPGFHEGRYEPVWNVTNAAWLVEWSIGYYGPDNPWAQWTCRYVLDGRPAE
jgi:hypothetical protein